MQNFTDRTPKSRKKFLDDNEQFSLAEYAAISQTNGQFGQVRKIYKTVCKNLEADGFWLDMDSLLPSQYTALAHYIETKCDTY